MDTRDYFSGLAIVISPGSFFLSYKNMAFQRRAKNVEARCAVIGKMFEVRRELSRTRAKIEHIRRGVNNVSAEARPQRS